jgi:hypothetical protein
MALFAALSLVLTFVLGTTTALAFYLVGGTLALRGPFVLYQSWPLIYLLEAVFVAAVMFVVGRLFIDRLTNRTLVAIVLAAWIGQYLFLASRVLADELNPLSAGWFWLLATGGPLQPAAAFVGGWFGLRPRGGRAGAGEGLDP